MKHLLLSLSLIFSVASAHASLSEGSPAPAAAPVAAKTVIALKGAGSTPAHAPLMLSMYGEPAAQPSFELMLQMAERHPEWTVEQITPGEEHVRVLLRSKDKKATLEMDTAQSMVTAAKLQKESLVTMNTQKMGQASLLRIMKDKLPLGFMASDGVQAPKN